MTSQNNPTLAEIIGADLGESTVSYDDADAILYALSVGAKADQLDLVYERDLTTLPSYACALGLWAVEAAGRLGAYDPKKSLHASQELIQHKPLPTSGNFKMTGRVANVYDKTKASIVVIEVTSEFFTATYNIFLSGVGGWGGDRGPASAAKKEIIFDHSTEFQTDENLAALYRLTGDRHPIHIDPELASASGYDRPILHGLCTLGIAALEIANQHGLKAVELKQLTARLAAPVLPGEKLQIRSTKVDGEIIFEVAVEERVVISGASATFN